jgi:hypothetical protein
MRTYILFLIVFLFCTTAYSQTGGGMRRGGQAGSGRTTGTQTIGAEGQRTGQRPSDGSRTREPRQGGNCNPGSKGRGIGAGGTTGDRARTGTGTRISQPNIRTNTGVRSF